jgi:membrane-associated protein
VIPVSPTLSVIAAPLAAGSSGNSLIDWVLHPDVVLPKLGPYMLVTMCLIVFAECGLLVGFFLPGDSLLFAAGMFATEGILPAPLWLVCVLLAVCAIVGNIVGFGIGWRIGPSLFNKPDSKLFKKEYVDKTHAFFDKHGVRAIVLARFVPIVRTFITAIAGVGRMDAKKFITYSVIGGVVWAPGVILVGAALGQISFVHKNLEVILLAIVVVSVLPIIIEAIRTRRERKSAQEETAVIKGLPRQ